MINKEELLKLNTNLDSFLEKYSSHLSGKKNIVKEEAIAYLLNSYRKNPFVFRVHHVYETTLIEHYSDRIEAVQSSKDPNEGWIDITVRLKDGFYAFLKVCWYEAELFLKIILISFNDSSEVFDEMKSIESYIYKDILKPKSVSFGLGQ